MYAGMSMNLYICKHVYTHMFYRYTTFIHVCIIQSFSVMAVG